MPNRWGLGLTPCVLVACSAFGSDSTRATASPVADAGTDGDPDAASGAVAFTSPEDFAKGPDRPTSIVVDATNAYWINEGVPGTPGSVLKLAKAAVDRAPVILSSVGNPVDLVQTVTDLFIGSNTNDGGIFVTLYRQPKASGGNAYQLAGVNLSLFGFALAGGDLMAGLAPVLWTPNEARDELAGRCSWRRRRSEGRSRPSTKRRSSRSFRRAGSRSGRSRVTSG